MAESLGDDVLYRLRYGDDHTVKNPCLFNTQVLRKVTYCHKGKSIIIKIKAVIAHASITVQRWDITFLTNVPHIRIFYRSDANNLCQPYSLWTDPESIE